MIGRRFDRIGQGAWNMHQLMRFPVQGLLLALVGSANAGLRVYPPPPLAASDQYAVRIETPDGWIDSYVNHDIARRSGNGSQDEAGKTFSWTTFATDAPVRVRVQRLEGPFQSCTLRPSRLGLTADRAAPDTAEFMISPGQKVSVEFDTEIKEWCYTGPPYGLACIKDAMMVFADEERPDPLAGIPETDIHFVSPGEHMEMVGVPGASPPNAGRSTLGDCGGKRVVVFRPGVHDIGYWQVPPRVGHIHIDGGAVVFGALDVLPDGRAPTHDAREITTIYRKNWRKEKLRGSFKLSGPGVLSGARLPWHLKKDFTFTDRDDWWAHVKLVQLAAAEVDVRDVTLANSPYWVLSWINDTDDRVSGTLDNFKIVGAWTYNNDGLPVPSGAGSSITNAFIHADDDAMKIYNSGAKVENVVVWQSNNGAVFQFGWFPKTVRNVSVAGIDIIHFENWYGVHQSNRAVFNYANAGGGGTIEDIVFRDVRIEGPVLRLFGFNTVGSPQVIRSIRFENLQVSQGMGAGQLGAPGRNYFLGDITGFSFRDFALGGSVIGSAEEALFDFGNGAGAGFTFTRSGGTPPDPAKSPVIR